MGGVARRLLELVPIYARLAWWGLGAPALREREPLLVVQGVVLSERGILLSVRSDLRGWELPGGNLLRGEVPEAALQREVWEETGIEVEVERRVGDYHRSGFRPHTARVYRCRPRGGELRPSRETPKVGWFELGALPETLFPWYRQPLADALAGDAGPVERHEYQGLGALLAGMTIDLRMRLSDDRAGLVRR